MRRLVRLVLFLVRLVLFLVRLLGLSVRIVRLPVCLVRRRARSVRFLVRSLRSPGCAPRWPACAARGAGSVPLLRRRHSVARRPLALFRGTSVVVRGSIQVLDLVDFGVVVPGIAALLRR